MLEFEKKILLTKEEYLFLSEYRYAGGKISSQINRYYDSEDFELNKKGITCRIREKGGSFTATVKKHSANHSDCSVEVSYSVSGAGDDFLFTDKGLKYQGSLTTLRKTLIPSSNIRVMLDKNQYLDTEDYELEVEYERGHESAALRELTDAAYDLFFNVVISNVKSFTHRIGQRESKSERFFKRKAELITSGTDRD